jgi:hypothetical protein
MPVVNKERVRVVGLSLDGYYGQAQLFRFKTDDFSTCVFEANRDSAKAERRQGPDRFVAWLMFEIDPQDYLED